MGGRWAGCAATKCGGALPPAPGRGTNFTPFRPTPRPSQPGKNQDVGKARSDDDGRLPRAKGGRQAMARRFAGKASKASMRRINSSPDPSFPRAGDGPDSGPPANSRATDSPPHRQELYSSLPDAAEDVHERVVSTQGDKAGLGPSSLFARSLGRVVGSRTPEQGPKEQPGGR